MGFPPKMKRTNTSYLASTKDTTVFVNTTSKTISITLGEDVNLTSFRVNVIRQADTGFTAGRVRFVMSKGSQIMHIVEITPEDINDNLINKNWISLELITSPLFATRGEVFSVAIDSNQTAGEGNTLETLVTVAGQYQQ